MTSIGSALVMIIVKGHRIPKAWILLYPFTIGWLLVILLAINNNGGLRQEEIIPFYLIILGVLIGRAFLDYWIGQDIYFPEMPNKF